VKLSVSSKVPLSERNSVAFNFFVRLKFEVFLYKFVPLNDLEYEKTNELEKTLLNETNFDFDSRTDLEICLEELKRDENVNLSVGVEGNP
jgi:hypothetical protein